MNKLLEVNDLTKQYSQGNVLARVTLTAADHHSFYIKQAEIFTLAGESGCFLGEAKNRTPPDVIA